MAGKVPEGTKDDRARAVRIGVEGPAESVRHRVSSGLFSVLNPSGQPH